MRTAVARGRGIVFIIKARGYTSFTIVKTSRKHTAAFPHERAIFIVERREEEKENKSVWIIIRLQRL